MELSQEQITELGLTEENAPKVTSFLADKIATTKQEFEGLANENAEKILTGASKKIFEDTKIERLQGEKVGDYLTRAWSGYNTNKLEELNKTKSEYEDKVKGFKGNEDLISKITNLESEKDTLLQKYADYDDIKGKAEQYEPLTKELSSFKKEVAFSQVKPNFPADANKYEVSAKWNEFKNNILDKYNIEVVDGESIAVSKENQHSQKKLSELVNQDETLKTLLSGRQQNGTGAKEVSLKEIQGVPFKVPENTDAETRTKLIREYLTTQGISVTSNDYAKKFAELNKAILSKK